MVTAAAVVARHRLLAGGIRAAWASPVAGPQRPGGQHGFDRFHALRFDTVVDAIEAFAAFAAWITWKEPTGGW